MDYSVNNFLYLKGMWGNMEGRVTQINVKSYYEFSLDKNETGLPKKPVDMAQVTSYGVGNDYNHYRTTSKQSTKDRAVLIYTLDMIEQLNGEGWPINPGDIGENITIDGLKYDDFKIGDKYQIGEVIVEVTEGCNPCKNLGALPYVGERVNEFIKLMENRRGWFVKVISEGNVKVNDLVLPL